MVKEIKGELGIEEVEEEVAEDDIPTEGDAHSITAEQFSELKQLKELLDAGILTLEEFKARKTKILGK